MKKMKTIIAIVLLLLVGCNSTKTTRQTSTLPDNLQVGQNILARDTITAVDYTTLSAEQCAVLAQHTGLEVPDSTQLIGNRQVDNGLTLDAYKIPTGEDYNQFKIYLVTRDSKGASIDALDLGEFHTSEHYGPMRFGGNRFYTTDASVAFDGKERFTVHRIMTLTSLYLKDHALTEMWRVEWDDDYEITPNGRFHFIAQQETHRTDSIDDPIIEDYKSRNIPK